MMRIVWRALEKEALAQKQQRMIEEEHQKIQKQIDSFMEHMKQITQNNNQQLKENIETSNKIETEMNNNVQETVITNNEVHEMEVLAINQVEDNKRDVSKERTSPKKREVPKMVVDMEERAKKRKEKREQLQKLYEEKQKAKEQQRIEEQRKKSEEERRRIMQEKEEKKRQELIKKSKEEAREKLKAKIRKAIEYHNKVLDKYSLKGFTLNVKYMKNKISIAISIYHNTLIKVKGLF